ncbi:predicted protein [Plenodomus lingam JN3]|uniref:Predicted protein n=1 Tax=Leptosphaeria maculans (strain JN3 / isolate v23.1.3 / race Av1-4-5-6-7-8) TaxID=985895 RepID=E5A4S0_LEPMJ|nr:predicted protein [Plenodomus lingam JN3]CBX98618.1 predicted protein [Plenodomus lingam JN3]
MESDQEETSDFDQEEAMLESPEVFPSRFPTDKYTDAIKFVQDENFKGRMSLDAFHTLWSRGCIEVDKFLDPDLRNDIHTVFARERFPHLRDDEYDYIRPATTLASRFILERNYLGFWLRLCAGSPRTRVDPNKKGEEVYIGEVDGLTAMKTTEALKEIAQHITWFNIDSQWSKRDPRRVAEVFMDADYQKCQRYKLFHDGDSCGSCSYCHSRNRGLCCICGFRQYREYGKDELRNVHKARGLTGYGRMSKRELIDALEADDDNAALAPNPAPSSNAVDIKVPRTRFHDIRVGLHEDMVKHIRDPKRDTWTRCEKLRFQSGLAATLVHELAHPFWYFAQKRCWSCFNPDPRLSETEPRHQNDPEIGVSWEYWAFGMRTPDAGRDQKLTNEAIPNIFQRHQWNYSYSTLEAGQSNASLDLVQHNFVIPFGYIHSWFQESTWRSIASKGTRACTIEPYRYAELVENGGLRSKARRAWMYGERFATAKQADRRLRQLLTDHNNRKKAIAKTSSEANPKLKAGRKSWVMKMLKGSKGEDEPVEK